MKKEKRDIFTEIREGFAALADERAGNITLTRHAVDIKPTYNYATLSAGR